MEHTKSNLSVASAATSGGSPMPASPATGTGGEAVITHGAPVPLVGEVRHRHGAGVDHHLRPHPSPSLTATSATSALSSHMGPQFPEEVFLQDEPPPGDSEELQPLRASFDVSPSSRPSEAHVGTTTVDIGTAAVVKPTSGSGGGLDTPQRPFRSILFELWKIAVPAAIGQLFFFLTQFTTSVTVGRRMGALGLEEFASGITSFNVGSISIGVGLISALDTLASQAFGRDPKSPEIGELFQRSLLLVTVFLIPCYIFFYFSEGILGLVFSAQLAAGASRFLGTSYVYLPVVLLNNVMYGVLNSVRLTWANMITSGISTAFCVVFSYLWLTSLESAVWIMTATIMINNCIMALILWKHPNAAGVRAAKWPMCDNLFTWGPIREYLKVGIPSLVAVCAEWWAFEFLLIIAATVSDTAVGCMTIVFNIFMLFFLMAGGLSKATTVCVGNAVGANDPKLAITTAKAAVLTVLSSQTLMAIIIYTFNDQLWRLWTSDPQIMSHVPSLRLWQALTTVLDGLQFTIQGVFRGVGRQDEAAPRVLFSLWAVGVCFAFSSSHYMGMDVQGIVLGIVLGLVVETPLLLRAASFWDWEALAIEASTAKESESSKD